MAHEQDYKLKDVTSLSLKPGEKQEVQVEGLDATVLLLNAAGTISCVGPKCTHYGAPLKDGVLSSDGRITCPWHAACFNAKTGDIEDAPALDSLAAFKLSQRDGAVYITGDPEVIMAGRRKPNMRPAAAAAGGSGSDADRVLVVGGGSGAIGTVECLRESGFAGPITIVSDEGYLPIDRPKLSKALLADLGKLQWRDEAFFKTGNIETMVDDAVTGVDFAAKKVTTKSGRTLAYGKLVLATGATPKALPLQGFQVLGNIFTLRNVGDVRNITAAVGEAKRKRIVIVGSSFIGMEVAGAVADGNDVAVIGMEKAPCERVFGFDVGQLIRKKMEAKGVRFHMEAGVDKAAPAAHDASKVGAVHLKDGTVLEADLVVLGIGVAPATDYLRDNPVVRLEGDGSLKTDETFGVVGLRDVYAVGDIATFPYHGPGGGGRYTRIEHWNVAQNAGRTAAGHIANPAKAAKRFIPVFWSALGAQLRYCGNTSWGWDEAHLAGAPDDEGRWACYYAKGDEVVAVASMGMDPVVTKSAELMRLGRMPTMAELKGGLDVLGADVAV